MANLHLGGGDIGCTTYLPGLSFKLIKMADLDLRAYNIFEGLKFWPIWT